MDLLQILVLIVIFFPFISSFSVGLFHNYVSAYVVVLICVISMIIVTTCSFILFIILYKNIANSFEFTLYYWSVFSNVQFEIGFLIDRLTTFMFVIVTFVSLMVHIYTIGYMDGDLGFKKFFCYISFFTFSMLILVSSNNFLQLFFGWEAVGLASYLLIGFWFKKESAIFANLKAFLMNRIGDFGFILGIAGIFLYFNTLNYLEIFKKVFFVINESFVISLLPNFECSVITLICICLFIGAMGKSAQIPLHTWLPDSMEGPTPISALIHAATMVTAGIFMTARMSPLFEYSATALNFILIIGTFTCFFMGLLGIVQNDIKRIIAYSTLSQLGLMVVSLGVSCYSLGLFHLMTHAFFKALLFLCAGSVIIGLHHNQNIQEMGNLRKYMPITYYTMLIGSLALCGLPGLSGFFSKDLILESLFYSNSFYSLISYYIVYLSIFITAFYTFRLFFLVFHGKERYDCSHTVPHESSFIVILPLIILSIPSICIGFFFIDKLIHGYFADSIFIKEISTFSAIQHHFKTPVIMFLQGIFSGPCIMAYLGIFSAWFFYLYKPNFIFFFTKNFNFIYKIFLNAYWFDYFNLQIIMKGTRYISMYFYLYIDQFLIDRVLVNGLANFILKVAIFLRRIQTGYLFHYVLFILFCLFSFLLIFLIK